jgi:hypothetical protein
MYMQAARVLPYGSTQAPDESLLCSTMRHWQYRSAGASVLLLGVAHVLLLMFMKCAAAVHAPSSSAAAAAAVNVWPGSVRMTYWGRKSHLSDSGVHMPVGYGSMPATEFGTVGTESTATALVRLHCQECDYCCN